MPKAYDLLVSQPVSTTGLSRQERSGIVISAVADADGSAHAVSRFGDSIWDLRPYFEQSNVAECFKFIAWPTDCPASLVDDCKAVLYAWFKHGLPGVKPPHRSRRLQGGNRLCHSADALAERTRHRTL
jgi:hypothetical protein